MATTLKRIRLTPMELHAIEQALLRDAARGTPWGMSSERIRKLARFIISADAVIVTPNSKKV